MVNKRLIDLAERMKSNGIIVPKNQNAPIINPENDWENVLVFSSHRKIFVLDKDKSVTQIAERNSSVYTLCSHQGILYDGGEENKLFETLSGKEIEVKTGYRVSALCSHNGKLYSAGGETIVEIFSGEVVAQREDEILCLCSHKGELYDGGVDKSIFQTLSNLVLSTRSNWIRGLCSYKGVLYDSGDDKKIFETSSNKLINERTKSITSLCSHEGDLYDGGCYEGIFKTFEKNLFYSHQAHIYSMCSHPRADFVKAGVLK